MLCSSRSSKISLRDFDISDLFAFNVLLPSFAPSFHCEWFSNATFSKRPSLASQSKRASKLLLSAFVESFSCLIFFFRVFDTVLYIYSFNCLFYIYQNNRFRTLWCSPLNSPGNINRISKILVKRQNFHAISSSIVLKIINLFKSMWVSAS